MPLEGEYEHGSAEYARKQVEAFEASGGAEANTMRGKPIIVLTSRRGQVGQAAQDAR